ncbi:MAG: SRPBCC family protein [Gemmataceae bacterium]
MPVFEATVQVSRSIADVFEFFARPANLLIVSPPELNLRLVEGPERLELGSRLVVQGRRWGIPQRIVSEVTAFEPVQRFVDEQREGPFARWIHNHLFETVVGGTQVTDRIEFDPPSGLLGLVMTASKIERDLGDVFAYRARKLLELL